MVPAPKNYDKILTQFYGDYMQKPSDAEIEYKITSIRCLQNKIGRIILNMAKNIKVNALASILVRVFNILFPLITGPYLARILSKEAYGEFNIANSILNLFIPFAAFGIYS